MNIVDHILAAESVKKNLPENIWGGKIFSGTDPTKIGWQDVSKFINETILPIAFNAATVVALLMILYSSFQYAIAYGDESKAETAKKTLIWSIVGLAVVYIARTAVNILKNELA